MADNLLYEISNTNEMVDEPFIAQSKVYIIDQNNGSYSNNTIILDSASISNSGRFCDFSTAYLTLPLLVTMTSTYNFSAINTDFVCGLKNSYTQLLNSVNIEYNNSSIVQVSNFTNMYISYRLNTTLDVNSVVVVGSVIGFALDSEQSWNYYVGVANIGTTGGMGSCNNIDEIFTVDFASSFNGTVGNLGFSRRQLFNTFTDGQNGVATILGAGWASTSSIYQRNFTIKSAIAINGYYQQAWNILATIRLKDISDFFLKLPLVRGAFIKIYLYLNQSKTTLLIKGNTVAPSAGKLSVQPSSIQIYGGNTNPLMIASAATTHSGMYPLSESVAAQATDQTFTFSVSLLNSLDSNCYAPYNRYAGSTSCRLYCNLYTLNPLKEEEYLLDNPIKTIEYRDIYQYQFLNTLGSFNFLVTNGISDLQEIIVVPIISSTTNGTGVSSTSFSPILSPFSTEPATCSPLMYINNFNIQLSGVNLFINSKQYGYEEFQDQLMGVNSINGGLSDGLMSGLISQLAFQNNYGYLVGNAARMLPEDSRTPRSVQILGNNLTQLPLDLYVFCVMKKTIQIQLSNGKRVS